MTSKVKRQGHKEQQGGRSYLPIGPGEPYTPNSEKGTNCLGPVEPYAPPTSKCAHTGKKTREPRGRPTTLAGPGSPFRDTRWLEYT